ncbi:MAG: YhdP family protein [Candidatus Accumulibacter sp.]|uniref:YhdP family protein n=1 Tax=Accumulibacter sp. TaxID=2053492 RepID=UPI0028783F52|nr:YhdP family protein [Accumulibacter sp.]MDS4013572.1 YhdP family protein [Accumulibacter sp.]
MAADEIAPGLPGRTRQRLPVAVTPALRAVWAFSVRAFWLIYFAFVLLILGLRYLVLPGIEAYRPDIEREASRALGLAVSIGRIEARWAGLNPDLILSDVRIADRKGQPALAFRRVESVLSWWSLPSLQLRLRLLQIDQPTLHLRREVDGRFFIAGIAVSEEGSNNDVADWVLAQKSIRVSGATVVWEDAKRGAPPLTLQQVNFALDNDGRRHRFGLTAVPPTEFASPIDLRGDFRGKDIEQASTWTGQAFAQLDQVDLAVWRAWLDYPVALPRGRGALRLWADFADGGLRELTGDFALDDVNLRLARDLPALDLLHMSGRVGVRFLADGASVQARGVQLTTRPSEAARSSAELGLRIEPSDFAVDWRRQSDGQTVHGKASASSFELATVAALAAYLPLDAGSRRLLDDFAPRGKISELRAAWQGSVDRLNSYTLKARFDDLALKARAYFPGVSGVSGVVDANEKGGSAELRAKAVTLDLPRVFPESAIALDTLNAQARWKISQGQLDAELLRAEFAGPDAAGAARGTYRFNGEGPGTVDLTASLSRAEARAVWRYLPRAVNADARHWVRDALKAGSASEAKLVLQGDLAHFPFLDRTQGQFLVTVKARDVVLDYAQGWPAISGIEADLRFEGAGMVVEAKRGAILGARLGPTRAQIADFDAPVATLKVKGVAEGETAEFLKFIAQSPVAAQIDHFTAPMGAIGKGRLDIGLTIPLAEVHLPESRVDGSYTFLANEVTVDPALPPLRQVNGTLNFSEKDLRVNEIAASFLGGPVKIRGSVQGGRVLVTTSGTIAAEEVRRRAELPVFEALSGSTTYRAEIRIRKREVELVIESNLVGIASTLAAPFAKAASDVLPLRIESAVLPTAAQRSGTPIVREQLRATLGSILGLQLIRRKQGDERVLERGAIAIGRPPGQIPERGIVFGISARLVDLDYWRNVWRGRGKDGASSAGSSLPPLTVDLKADELVILGKHYNEVSAGINGAAAQWRGYVNAREAIGSFQWDGTGAGKLSARFKKWRRPEKTSEQGSTSELLDELPALDIVVDDFIVGDHHFGHLDVQAHNDGGIWLLDRIVLSNPFGSLTGRGQWQVANGNRTQLDFALESNDVGRLLDRLGHGGTMRAGNATMNGRIGWQGSPAALDYATLSGDMALEANKGQFLKLDPGAAGKLLGLISLQGLPRRFLLDFGDVFSEGFAFDRISGKMTVSSGLMRSDRLQIDGPAARVVLRGETDLKRETQRLAVSVQPELGGSAALGVAVVNPLAGVATLLAHRMLQNPLNRVFASEYLITGTWADPKVEKLTRAKAAPASVP